ncbi:hypothetical protein Pcinc_007703 [Petrolisthes cinctipes]|uniref:Uncharacterized protein n=1 Tax=Petrolisthes cinctipes TaxID=88211 RepID=A0AAE1G806_PETCI|nr:hypothetical protein Pcinc_007703 [Petrolisthes cinctipes]
MDDVLTEAGAGVLEEEEEEDVDEEEEEGSWHNIFLHPLTNSLIHSPLTISLTFTSFPPLSALHLPPSPDFSRARPRSHLWVKIYHGLRVGGPPLRLLTSGPGGGGVASSSSFSFSHRTTTLPWNSPTYDGLLID